MRRGCEMSIQFEHTDTFAGESNYSWVRRGEYAGKRPESRLSIVRHAKAWAGLTGIPCRVDNFGDMLAIWPRGVCQVVFITWEV